MTLMVNISMSKFFKMKFPGESKASNYSTEHFLKKMLNSLTQNIYSLPWKPQALSDGSSFPLCDITPPPRQPWRAVKELQPATPTPN